MPTVSKAQERLMQAAAHTPGGFGGVPQSVGKEFTKSDDGKNMPAPKYDEIVTQDSQQSEEWLEKVLLAEMIKPDDTEHIPDEPTVLSTPNLIPETKDDGEAWQTKEGKNKNGGLNEKGRESYNKTHGAHLKAPQPEGGKRKESFCARMKGMKEKLTSSKTANDPDSRINKSLRKWKCDELRDEMAAICDALVDYVQSMPDEDPCWEGYEQYGMKQKDGKQVPNCIPKEDATLTPEPATVIAGEDDDGGNREGNVIGLDANEKDSLRNIHGHLQEIAKLVKDFKLDAEQTSIASPIEVMPVNKDAGATGRAAGIMFVTKDGQILMIRRGDGGDYPNTWAVPGGHQDNKETLEEAARREVLEEVGFDYKGALEVLYDNGQFCTYIARDVDKFDVKLNYESSGFDWCDPSIPPMPLHPGQEIALRVANAKTELDIAELMKEEILPSPQPYANMDLLAIRITGTGLAYRSSIEETVWRDPSLYLNDEFLRRCNGLTVIMDHPESAVLTPDEFKDRAIGSIMLPYIKGDEVWGIAKIYDQDAMKEILEGEISTSPSVVFDNTAGNTTLTTEDGKPLLIEGVPFLLDHIAIVTKARGSKGVWDKGGDPAGVLLTNLEVSDMTNEKLEPKADAQGDKLDAILAALGNLAARVDSMEKDKPAPALVTAVDKKADEETQEEAKKEMMRKADEEEAKDDAEGSNPVVHGVGEIKPDEDEEAKMDEDEEEAAKADEDEAAMCDAQAKADSVYAAFGKSASRPLKGENLMSYRKRMARGLQAYSDAYKEVNLAAIKDAKLLEIAEKQIFADALAAAKSPTMYAADAEIEIHEKDRAGRMISKFKGGFGWMEAFKVPSLRVTEFKLNNNKR